MANKIPVLTQLKAVAAAAKNFTMKNVSELAETAVAAIEEVEQNAVPKTRKVNGKALSADITLNASDVSAAASGHTHSGYVPTTRKVNNKALSADISLTASDVGAAASGHTHSNYVPTTRKVNGKALSADITLGASDVGAAPTSHSHSNYLTTSQRGAANGVASLGDDGKVPASQLGSVGLLPQITVTTSAGASVYCKGAPLGENTLGWSTTGNSNKYTFDNLPGYGVYTITASKDGASKSATVNIDTVKQYNIILPVDCSATLKDNTWAQIAAASEKHIAKDIWQIGDEIDIALSGETLTLVILGFEHDDLADGSGKAGITFGLKNLMKDKRAINSSHTFYQNTTMHSWLNSTVYNGMPAELRNVIKSVNKTVLKTVNMPPNGAPELTYGAISTKVFLPAVYEASGYGSSKEGNRYSYYATNSSLTKRLSNGSGSIAEWWTRSYFEGLNPSYYWYCGAQESGMPAAAPSESKGVSFNFCV